MNRKFISTTNDKDDRHRDTSIKAKLRNCRSADEADDLSIITKEPTTNGRWGWDKRRVYPANAARRWIETQARKGVTWDSVRHELAQKLGSTEEADYLVEHTAIIDGKIQVKSAYFGPTPLEDYYKDHFVAVMPDGKLKYHQKKKGIQKDPKDFFFFDKESVWFKLENGTVFQSPIRNLRARTVESHTYQPIQTFGFIYTGYNRKNPAWLQEKEILLSETRQVATKKVPPQAKQLTPIPKKP